MPLVRKPPTGTFKSVAPARDDAAVLTMLVHGTDEQRWSAARAAAALPGSVPALAEALTREKNPRVREAVLTSLARIATPESVETVLPLLRSDDAFVRREACDALLAMQAVAWPYVAALLCATCRTKRPCGSTVICSMRNRRRMCVPPPWRRSRRSAERKPSPR